MNNSLHNSNIKKQKNEPLFDMLGTLITILLVWIYLQTVITLLVIFPAYAPLYPSSVCSICCLILTIFHFCENLTARYDILALIHAGSSLVILLVFLSLHIETHFLIR